MPLSKPGQVNNHLIRTKMPVLSLVFFWIFFLATLAVIIIGIFKEALMLKEIIIFIVSDVFIYAITVRQIRIYTFYENEIQVKAPYMITQRFQKFNLEDIQRIVYSRRSQGPEIFRFELKEGKHYSIPFNRGFFRNNSYDEIIQFFKKHNILLKRQISSGNIVDFDAAK